MTEGPCLYKGDCLPLSHGFIRVDGIFFSKATWPIKTTLHVEHRWVCGVSGYLDHMTKMAPQTYFSPEPKANDLQYSTVALGPSLCLNDDLRLTLTYYVARSITFIVGNTTMR